MDNNNWCNGCDNPAVCCTCPNANTKLLFVYGTLKRGYGNNRLLTNSEFVGEAVTTEKHALYRNGIPYLKTQERVSKVYGEVYRVKEGPELNRIDSLEGHPNWYRRTPIEVEVNDQTLQVETYAYLPDVSGCTLVTDGKYV